MDESKIVLDLKKDIVKKSKDVCTLYRINDFYFCIFFMISQNRTTYIEKSNTVPFESM